MSYSTCSGHPSHPHRETRTCDRCDGCPACGDVPRLQTLRGRDGYGYRVCAPCRRALLTDDHFTHGLPAPNPKAADLECTYCDGWGFVDKNGNPPDGSPLQGRLRECPRCKPLAEFGPEDTPTAADLEPDGFGQLALGVAVSPAAAALLGITPRKGGWGS